MNALLEQCEDDIHLAEKKAGHSDHFMVSFRGDKRYCKQVSWNDKQWHGAVHAKEGNAPCKENLNSLFLLSVNCKTFL